MKEKIEETEKTGVCSEQFDWKRMGWTAMNCTVELDLENNDPTNSDLARTHHTRLLIADSMLGNMDYRNGVARFETEIDNSPVFMPYHDYKLSLINFGWNHSSDIINLGIGTRKNREKIKFMATYPESDSIQFEASDARLALKSGLLSLFGINYIPCADAWIYPPEGAILIGQQSKIQKLVGARIVFDTLTKAHEVVDVQVEIKSKNKYTGTGFYQYLIDGGTPQRIQLDNIWVDSNGVSRASAEVFRDSGFIISPGIGFGGNLSIRGDSPEIVFSGVGLLKNIPNSSWSSFFRIDARFNPRKNDGLYFSRFCDNSGIPLHTGLFMNSSRTAIYPLIIGKKRNQADSALAFMDGGTILYDNLSSNYKIVAPENALNGSYSLHTFFYSAQDNLFVAEGRLWCIIVTGKQIGRAHV